MSNLILPPTDIVVAKNWEGVPNPIRNTSQPYLKFLNTGVFQEDGRRFLRYGYYTNAPYGSKDYNDYWDEQENRVINGYSVGGVRVTGRHYFYLNFCLIKARPIDPITGAEKEGENRKIITLPRFLDHNFYWFHEFERCAAEGPYTRFPKKGMIVAKSRRKGFTYQVTGGVYGYNFNFIPASTNILAAYEKGHYKVTLDGIHFTINHINKNTDWGKKQGKLSKRDHFRASFVIKNPHTGIEVEDGYMSEVQAVSFKDNPFKSIGESTDLMGFEECLGKGTKVLMYSKELKNVEDIQVGDQIMGIDSLPKTVIRTISGTDELYKIKQQKGIEYIVNSRHKLHLLQKTSNVNYTKIDGVYNLNISELESLPKYRRRTIYGMKSKGLQYPKKEIFLDPYLVGLWLGDGDKKSLSIVVNKSKDREIQEYLESYSLESGYDLKEYKTNCKHDDVATFTIHRQKHDCIKGRYTQELQNLNVLRNKNIPEDYLYNDENSRLELLAGIIDADGYLCKGTASYSFGYEIVQKNKKLSDDIVTLCRQLGFYTNVKLKKSSSQNGYIGVAYRITIRGDLKRIPVRTERKKLPDDYTPTSDPLNTQIVVEHIGKGEFYGFTLDGTRDVDHLFMLEDLTITHNCGKFEHLLTAYTISEPTFRDGDIMTGVPLMWGCVCKGTKVWTNTGKLVNIEDLKQDDGILGYDGNGISKEPIVWMKPPAKKPCYKIKTTGGNYIECSNDHPLMTSNRNKRNYKKGRGFVYDATFTEAEKIQVGDYLLMTTEVPVFGNNSISYARELGLMIGDGNYSVNSTPQLSVGEEEIYDYVNSKYNVNIIKHFLQKDNSNFRLIQLKELKPLIRKHGMYGQVKENKRLPEDIDQFDRKSISELIGGYFDADGNVTYNKEKSNLRLVLTSISYELLEQVKYQLIKFGIGSSIYKENRNEGTKISEGQNDHIYRLYISKKDDVIAFRNNITLLSKKKQNLLNQYKIDGKRSMFRLKNVDFKLNPDNNKGTFFINKINMQNLRYEQVTSIEYIGEQEIYNLHTGISNTYLSNGFITKQTGGDMERGTKDFAEMFYDPAPYGLQAYENIYDENATGDCGWFIDDMWYYPGSVVKTYYIDKKEVTEVLPFVDNQGNSHRVIAEQSLDMKREQRRKGSRSAYNKFITQQPKTPAEAFLRVQGTMFDTIRASARLSQIETNKKTFIDSIWKANLVPDIVTGKIKFEYDEEGIPLHEFPIKSNKQKGCIEIYEMPHFDDFGQVPFGRYIAGIDPYDDDQSTTNSVASIFVLDLLTDRIVCHYKGRPETADNSYEIMRKILKFYNAVANYERNKKGLYGYFYNKNCLHLLVDEPEILKDKGISKSNTFGNNSKGSMGSAAVNYYGLQRALQWMSSIAYGEEPESEIINLDKIRSVPLLKEIIAWNPQDNFDDISALGMLMILREDRLNYKDKINKSKTKAVANDQFFDRHINSGHGENGYSNSTILDYIKTESIKKN